MTQLSDLRVGEAYERRALHLGGLGGTRQGGISYPRHGDYVLLFSNPTLGSLRHRDGPVGADDYFFSGEWNGPGDMQFQRGNQAIIHRRSRLHLFVGSSSRKIYWGHYEYISHQVLPTPHRGAEHNAILFRLRRIPPPPPGFLDSGDLWSALDRWRVRRYESKPSWDSYQRFGMGGHGSDPSALQLPPFVLEFIRECLRGRAFGEAIDPHVSLGTVGLLISLAEAHVFQAGLGIVERPEHLQALRQLRTSPLIDWVPGDGFGATHPGPFDLVVSAPPRSNEQSIVVGNQVFRDRGSNFLTLDAAQRLNPSGVAVLFLDDSFLRRSMGARAALRASGARLDAAIALPTGSLGVASRHSMNIIFVRPGQSSPTIFVGQLEAGTPAEELAANLRERRAGSGLSLGQVVNESEFTTWQRLLTARSIDELAAAPGVYRLSLRHAAVSVVMGSSRAGFSFPNAANAVYLPLFGNSPATVLPADLRIEPRHAAQIVLRPELARAGSVAAFFNGEVGQRVRHDALSGIWIQRITKASILEMDVLLPAL